MFFLLTKVEAVYLSCLCKGPFIATQLNSTQLDVELLNSTSSYSTRHRAELSCVAIDTLTLVGAVVQLVEYRTRNQEVAGSTHTRSTASNLQQVANLLRAQANSASYPQRDGK